ncbi:hypothetical protein FOA52_004019 [Chlamydomonas sp. UWO 241]|nr:hypothetical protein FOA52_004019 [Chlamydomonas sp. UWO 241]
MDSPISLPSSLEGGQLIEAVPETSDVDVPAIQEAAAEPAAVQGNDEWSGSYTWYIENINDMGECEDGNKRYSPKFEVATYYWRMLIFPQGNRHPPNGTPTMSAFVDAPDAVAFSAQMSPAASFTLHIENQLFPGKKISKDTEHTFTSTESDWGFSQFVALEEIYNPENGWIVNNRMILKVDLRVKRDERYNLDARKGTGFVGLKNQGATCYINSLLQSLYLLPCFRTAVYHMPTNENDEASKSLPLALQSLFYKLQYSRTHVSTKDLTKSFGWGTYDAFMQHDIQELSRVLCEKLEEKMRGTKVERVINELFEGETYGYIECINVDYKSTRKESFMDLQLVVKGCKDVYASFRQTCEVEVMEGDNQYKAEGYGHQDARKGVLFNSLPPVLQLHLRRFDYDVQRDTMVKINDRYEFPETLDLDFEDRAIFSPEADTTVVNKYLLHSVLVHSGGVHGGHYFAFIRPDGQKWYKFDDDHVEASDKQRACDEQFGAGGMDEDGVMSAPALRYARSSNAYMLVYVRESDWDKVVAPTTKEDITPHLLERFEQEQVEKEARQKMKQEAHLYCTLKLATDSDIAAQVGVSGSFFDLCNHAKLPTEHIFRLKKNIRFPEFKLMVEQQLGVPVAAQRYWTWEMRENQSFRPGRPLNADEETKVLMDLREHREQRHGAATQAQKQSLMDIKLFLETPLARLGSFDLGPGPLVPKGEHKHMIMFKYYNPVTESLSYVGRMHVSKNSRLSQITADVQAMCGLPLDAEIECFEEIHNSMVERVSPKATMEEGGIKDGDIILVQRRHPNSQASQEGVRFQSVATFLSYIHNRRVVVFKKLDDPKEPGLSLELLREMDYESVCAALAHKLGLEDPTWLRLTQHNAYTNQPQRTPVRYRQSPSLELMLTHSHRENEVLYYEVLDMPLAELEKLKTLRVSFYNDKAEFVAEHNVRLSKEGCVADVLTELGRLLGPAAEGRRLRLMEVYNSKVYKVCDDSEPVDCMKDNYWHLRAECVPADQEGETPPGFTLLHVCHFALPGDKDTAKDKTAGDRDKAQDTAKDKGDKGGVKDGDKDEDKGGDKDADVREARLPLASIFGAPFLLRIRDDEPVSEIQARIQAKLGVSDEEWAKWRFAFLPGRLPEYLEGTDTLGERLRSHSGGLGGSEGTPHLGLGHENKAPGRKQQGGSGHRSGYSGEKSIKINS